MTTILNPFRFADDHIIPYAVALDGVSAYLHRTATAANAQTHTQRVILKRSRLGATQVVWAAGASSDTCFLRFNADDTLEWRSTNGSLQHQLVTTRVFRDTQGWYDIVTAYDSTPATPAAEDLFIEVNGVRVTEFSTEIYPASGTATAWGGAGLHTLGSLANGAPGQLFDGLIAGFVQVDGVKYESAHFGRFSDLSPLFWTPRPLGGLTFGAAGSHLDFADGAAPGQDVSGKGNHWTAVALSPTDRVTDSPTNGYATLNPLACDAGITLTDNNRTATASTGSYRGFYGSIALPASGKWAWQYTPEILGSFTVNESNGGLFTHPYDLTSAQPVVSGHQGLKVGHGGRSLVHFDGTSETVLDAGPVDTNSGTPVEWLVNLDDNEVTVKDAAASYGPYALPTLDDGEAWYVWGSVLGASNTYDFGQNGYVPSDPAFRTLSRKNLPDPAIVNAGDHFHSRTVTHDGAATEFPLPAWVTEHHYLVQIKTLTGAGSWYWLDTLRGLDRPLHSDNYDVESVDGQVFSQSGAGGSLASGLPAGDYLIVLHRAGPVSAAAANTQGSLATSVSSVNPLSGFAIHLYAGTGSAATYGHGLGRAPELVLTLCRDTAGATRGLYHRHLASAAHNVDFTAIGTQVSDSGFYNAQAPTDTLFSVGSANGTNKASASYVSYAWTGVAGYSDFGAYTGQADANGVFLNLGFRPRHLLFKNIDSNSGTVIVDAAAYPGNSGPSGPFGDLRWDSPAALASSGLALDLLSTGVKHRAHHTYIHTSDRFVYGAWGGAGKYANGR